MHRRTGDRPHVDLSEKLLDLSRFFHPVILFAGVNLVAFGFFFFTPAEMFRKELFIPKGDPVLSLLLMLLTASLFATGSMFAAGLPIRSRMIADPLPRETFHDNLSLASNALFVVAIIAFVSTAYTAGVGLSTFTIGQFNAARDAFYASYNVLTPFRIFFLSAWIVRFYLVARGRRFGMVSLVLGLASTAMAFTLISSRLSVLIIAVGFIMLVYRGPRRFVWVFPVVAFSAPVLLGAFIAGTYLRDARVASGDFSALAMILVGYFGTPYNYLPSVLEYCSPEVAPLQLLLSPIFALLSAGSSAPLFSPNIADTVCNLPAFYNASFTPFSLPGELYISSGSLVVVAAFLLFYGFLANAAYRLYKADNDYGLLLYPMIAATLFDSYRLSLITQNFVFGNLLALLTACFLCKRIEFRLSSERLMVRWWGTKFQTGLTLRFLDKPLRVRLGGAQGSRDGLVSTRRTD